MELFDISILKEYNEHGFKLILRRYGGVNMKFKRSWFRHQSKGGNNEDEFIDSASNNYADAIDEETTLEELEELKFDLEHEKSKEELAEEKLKDLLKSHRLEQEVVEVMSEEQLSLLDLSPEFTNNTLQAAIISPSFDADTIVSRNSREAEHKIALQKIQRERNLDRETSVNQVKLSSDFSGKMNEKNKQDRLKELAADRKALTSKKGLTREELALRNDVDTLSF